MGKQYKALENKDIDFIQKQKVFFIASASGKEVNLAPKGYDCIHIIDNTTLLYLDYPGSGNRTARDIESGGQATLLFTAFSGKAMILRLFCKGELVEKSDERFDKLFSHFKGAKKEVIRRLIQFNIFAVETSCGFGVPYFDYKGERKELGDWAEKKSEAGKLEEYIQKHHEPPNLEAI